MTKHARFHLLLIGLTLFCACKKHNDPPKDPEEKIPQYKLKAITWDNGVKGEFVYNSENNLQHIDYTFQNVAARTVFGWTGNTFTEMYDDRSMYKNVFEYDTEGKPVKMRNIARTGTMPSEYYFEFIYNANKKLEALKYYVINEAGKELKASSTYSYTSSGDLEKCVTQMGVNLITHTIEAYSPPVSYLPCTYLDFTLNENYTIYNLAFINQLHKQHKLPSKVTRVVKTDNDPSYVDKIEEQIFTVNNYKIEKINTTITYPQMPTYVNRLVAVYSYFY